ncbi:uncharacterized protein P884DRAFT_20551 [Thermothelomyces heterothallicus CBS 202.75]|uniref:uncharacterized protein n=1 Tax=Thermothelomyces heterothallicus CBS 202.75 TaxID=1149848 RepID=UPI003743179A
MKNSTTVHLSHLVDLPIALQLPFTVLIQHPRHVSLISSVPRNLSSTTLPYPKQSPLHASEYPPFKPTACGPVCPRCPSRPTTDPPTLSDAVECVSHSG